MLLSSPESATKRWSERKPPRRCWALSARRPANYSRSFKRFWRTQHASARQNLARYFASTATPSEWQQGSVRRENLLNLKGGAALSDQNSAAVLNVSWARSR